MLGFQATHSASSTQCRGAPHVWLLALAFAAPCACASDHAEMNAMQESEPSDEEGRASAADASRIARSDASANGRAMSVEAGVRSTRTDAGRAADTGAGSTRTDAGRAADTGAASPTGVAGRLFYLDALGGRVLSMGTDGRDIRALVTGLTGTPDGVAVDPAGGYVYWTNMGVPSLDDGSISRVELTGSRPASVVPTGATFTPKQLVLDPEEGALYWSDREGMQVMRSRGDGTGVEALVTIAEGDAARRDAANWAVGIAVDRAEGYVYWTQKGPDDGGRGSIRRAPLELPAGEDSAHRSDVEVLFEGLPEPIDLALDLSERLIYWTDRGDNTVNRAALKVPSGEAPSQRTDREVLVRGLNEAIGLTLDRTHGDLYYTDLGGSVGTAKLDGSNAKTLARGQGSLTGIVYAELPP